MAAAAGKLMLLEMQDDGAVPAYVAIGGLRSRSLTLNSEIIDVTHSDSTGLWRSILPGVGVRSMAVTGSGIADTKAALAVIQDAFGDQTHRLSRITVPGHGTYAGAFRVSSFELSGEYNDAIQFSTTIESSGEVTFTAEA